MGGHMQEGGNVGGQYIQQATVQGLYLMMGRGLESLQVGCV